ncbi:MAG TPA: hypothetical protein VES19_03160 [Candidatus Limnocylindrales bacterium]|nr:hypothetical protein [Candidatus Limnocylindrales bacterium]
MTFTALVAAVLVLLAIAAAALVTGNGIFSPGRLSAVTHVGPLDGVTSHADLEARCDACHAPAWSSERMADRCLACHTQVREELTAGDGLHGHLPDAESRCRDCHTDHRGPSASLTLADPRVFPHEETGYALTAHPLSDAEVTFGCRDCHPASPQSYSAPTCAACHQHLDATYMEEHEATFGTACLGCHDGIDSYGSSFDHATYPLTGGHQTARCGACHQKATTIAALQATSTICLACHGPDDIHEGRLGTTCSECHSPATWTDATIDHDRTRYPLVGKHVGAACLSCHVDRHWTGIETTCRSCHAKDDPHLGQFPGDCARCHAPTGWDDVTFDHSETDFKLTGAHAEPPCFACHANGRYVGTPTACFSCHAKDDEHNGSFGTGCASCHQTKAWKPASYNGPHRFPMRHGGANGICSKCHPSSFLTYSCARCHSNARMIEEHNDERGFTLTTCVKCHPTGRGD